MRTRVVVSLLVLSITSVAFLVLRPGMGSTADRSVVDLTGVASSANCSPCHERVAEGTGDDITFSHAMHLLFSCDSCHLGVAHKSGKTARPTMQSCFSCHGLLHGPGGLIAERDCLSCHKEGDVLRPASHVKDWAAKPHADVSKMSGPNDCMMCHTAFVDCDRCHQQEKVDVGPMPRVYLRLLPERETRPSVIVDTAATPTMSSCTFCHDRIDTDRNPDVVFVHEPHIERGFKCDDCHASFPHLPRAQTRPDMLSCYRCHSLKHAAWGDVAPEECKDCHPESFKLEPSDHGIVFKSGGHAEKATAAMSECTMCHESAICVPCHVGGELMPDKTKSPQVLPATHLKREWRPEHGTEYLGQRGACSICHTNESCLTCHQTAMPHPSQWLSRHAVGNGYPKDDCKTCHLDREDCHQCHHAKVAKLELIAENCVDCHEEMKTEPATKIKNIGLAEHAVHFDVVERVGRPYVCDDCHIGFSTAHVLQPASPTQVHDLRLCYDCHGNLDVRKLQIAPWPGSELCRRCHTDLKI